LGVPGSFYFAKGGPPRTHHLHIDPAGHPSIEGHLLFRNYLRADPAAAIDYAGLKRALTEKFRNNREACTAAKSDFIESVEAKDRRQG